MSKVSVDSLNVLSQLSWQIIPRFPFFSPQSSQSSAAHLCVTPRSHLTPLTIIVFAEPLFGLFSMITLLSLVASTLLSLSLTLVLGVLTRVDR